MQKPTTFRVLDADPDISQRHVALSVQEVAETVVALDVQDGRVQYDPTKTSILQIPAARSGAPFFVHSVPARENRPRHPGKDPLCVEAARAIGQHFVVLETPNWNLLALANPFAYMAECVTWATAEHLPQRCGEIEGTSSWKRVFSTMLFLCSELLERVVGFNETVGNSLNHLHMVSHRAPEGLGRYPAQLIAERIGRQARPGITHIGPHNGYPTHVWRVDLFDPDATAQAAAALVSRWCRIGGEFASANAAAVMENGHATLYVIPRHRLLTAIGWQSTPAFLEMLGVFIAGHGSDFDRVKLGDWGYEHIWQVLSSLQPIEAARVPLHVTAA